MSPNKVQAAKLVQDMGDFLRVWGQANGGGPIEASIALSAFGSMLAYAMAAIPDEISRVATFRSMIQMLVENSDVDVLVSVLDCPKMAQDAMLAAAKPAGRA
jgi:hypothetical protein